jgi:hypothetical protein
MQMFQRCIFVPEYYSWNHVPSNCETVRINFFPQLESLRSCLGIEIWTSSNTGITMRLQVISNSLGSDFTTYTNEYFAYETQHQVHQTLFPEVQYNCDCHRNVGLVYTGK